MVMLRPPGKAYAIAKKVLKQQGVNVPKRDVIQKAKVKVPRLLH
jgi:hypothetical protein